METELYILDEDDNGINLILIKHYSAFEYYNGKWHENIGLYSMKNDPTPGIFISKQDAMQVMKRIDGME